MKFYFWAKILSRENQVAYLILQVASCVFRRKGSWYGQARLETTASLQLTTALAFTVVFHNVIKLFYLVNIDVLKISNSEKAFYNI